MSALTKLGRETLMADPYKYFPVRCSGCLIPFTDQKTVDFVQAEERRFPLATIVMFCNVCYAKRYPPAKVTQRAWFVWFLVEAFAWSCALLAIIWSYT